MSHNSSWDVRVPIFLLAYRALIHNITGLTPANLVLRRKFICPMTYYSMLP
jgi:hypothetical protein